MTLSEIDEQIREVENRIAVERIALEDAVDGCVASLREVVTSPKALLALAGVGFAVGSVMFRGGSPVHPSPATKKAGLAALLVGPRLKDGGRALVWLAALAIFVSGAIGVWHAGIELKLLPGATQCTAALAGSADEMLKAVFDRPMVRCDDIQWSWLGISMAGWNAIISLLSALVILWLSLRKKRTA